MARSLLLCALLAVCALSLPRSASPRPLAPSCSSAAVGATVRGFVRAFDLGDRARLDASFARDDGDGDAATPSFQWYSTGPPGARLGTASHDRATLVPYLLRRHRRGERLRLVTLSAGGYGHGYFNFGFHIRRSAPDLRRPGVFQGKGAAICAGRRALIAVWSVGGRVSS